MFGGGSVGGGAKELRAPSVILDYQIWDKIGANQMVSGLVIKCKMGDGRRVGTQLLPKSVEAGTPAEVTY